MLISAKTAFVKRLSLAAVAALLSLPFTPALGVLAAPSALPAIASTTSWRGVATGLAADPKSGCKPDNNGDHPNNDNDKKKCPPPVVPEAPLAALLPLTAAVMVGGAYVLLRIRRRSAESA